MGDYSPHEKPAEMLSRLALMVHDKDGAKWDLSENDRAAIKYALDEIRRLQKRLEKL